MATAKKIKLNKSFDRMDGFAFEEYCATLLRKNGFRQVQVTSASKDQGIDILAYKKGLLYGIQCKNYSNKIPNKAVQEAYAGSRFYQCDQAVVLTNNYFTNSAFELAQETDVLLWDRDTLLKFKKSGSLAGSLCGLLLGILVLVCLFFILYYIKKLF